MGMTEETTETPKPEVTKPVETLPFQTESQTPPTPQETPAETPTPPVPPSAPQEEPPKPETPADAPSSGSSPKAREEVNVAIETKAKVEWLDDKGEILKTETCWRSAVSMFIYLAEKLKAEPTLAKSRIKVYLKGAGDSKEVFVLAEGTVVEVLARLNKRVIMAPNAMTQLQLVIQQLAEFSDLKCVVITGVFGIDEPAAAGFGFMSEASEVSDEDIKVLVTSAAGQLDMFKDQMRKKRGIVFDEDKGNIIIPGRGFKMR